jgi:hypothetical protein
MLAITTRGEFKPQDLADVAGSLTFPVLIVPLEVVLSAPDTEIESLRGGDAVRQGTAVGS